MRTFAALSLLLLLSACSADTVTVTLEAAVDAALATASFAYPEYAPYLTEARTCLEDATAILSSSDGAWKKAADIALACSVVATASLPPGTPPAVVLVASTLQAFLRAVSPRQALAADQHPRMRLNASAMARIRAKVARLR